MYKDNSKKNKYKYFILYKYNMKYGSLEKDDVIIDIDFDKHYDEEDDELDIIDFINDVDNRTQSNICESDIKSHPKQPDNRYLETSTALENTTHIDCEPRAIPTSSAFVQQTHSPSKSVAVCSKKSVNLPIVLTICNTIELTVPQMVILFISIVCLEYVILLIITH
jgi:hypothetical protein